MAEANWWAAATLFAVAAPAGEKPAPEPGVTYATPREVFDAFRRAQERGDFKTFLRCATPESRDRLIGTLAVAAAKCRDMSRADDPQVRRLGGQFEKALARHGLTAEVLAKYPAAAAEPRLVPGKPVAAPDPVGPKEVVRAVKALPRLVKDKPAFFRDVMALFDKMNADEGGPPRTELKDVKVAGNKARGFAVYMGGGKERRDRIDFVKVGGGWRVVLNVPPPSKSAAPAEKKE